MLKKNELITFSQKGRDDLYKVWHNSENNMIIYTDSVGGHIVCNEKMYPIQKGALCFVGGWKYHYTMPDAPDEYVRHKLFISTNTLKTILSLFSQEHPFCKLFTERSLAYAVIPEEEREKVGSIFKNLKQAENDTFGFEELYIQSCISLMKSISENMVDSVKPIHVDIVNRAIEYISIHIYEEISVESICGAIHVTKAHLCRQFKKATNITVMEYILKTRIILAQNMLANENLTIGEVSEKCAFSSISYFCRVFKKEIGCTPSKYRKINQRR